MAGTAIAAGAAVEAGCGHAAKAQAAAPTLPDAIELPLLQAPGEGERSAMPNAVSPASRIGIALVGLGRLTLEQIMPAFAQSKWARPVALVSGDAAKAAPVAEQYGIAKDHLYDYASFDRIADSPDIQGVYIVLPNSMHAEYTVRAAKAGKHVLCEKPMANTVDECTQMIDACAKAGKKLMIAYRCQYEPHHREMIRLARSGELGALKAISAINGQTQGTTDQWRLHAALAGGGALPDVGIYCLNAARFVTGEEPIEVSATMYSAPDDARFREVEETVDFTLRFPSGVVAQCLTSYGLHASKRYRVMGADGWAEMDPAFPYQGMRLRVGKRGPDGVDQSVERMLEAKNQFTLELDHFAECIAKDTRVLTPGEEGLQDMRIVEAIYRAAREGTRVKLEAPAGLDVFRGPAPAG